MAIDSKVTLVTTEERGFTVAVELAVSLPAITDPAKAVELVRAAHQVCPYSNATRGNIDVALTANGEDRRLIRDPRRPAPRRLPDPIRPLRSDATGSSRPAGRAPCSR